MRTWNANGVTRGKQNLGVSSALLGALLCTLYGLAGAEQPPAAKAGAEVPKAASAQIPPDHLREYSDLAVKWMQEYLRVDTTNPPGNEMRAVAFYKKILDQEGIENRVFEYSPGRGDLWARIPHID